MADNSGASNVISRQKVAERRRAWARNFLRSAHGHRHLWCRFPSRRAAMGSNRS